MHTVKITSIGNSAGIILSKEILAMLGAKKGDTLFAIRTPNGVEFTDYDPKLARQMEIGRKVMHENRDALRKLAE